MGALYRDLVRKHSKAKGSARALLNILADYADDNGMAWPGRAALANDSGMSERNVIRCIQKLCEDGRLVVEENAVGGRGKVPVYKIVFPDSEKGDNLTPKTVTTCHPLDSKRVTNEQQKGDKLSLKGDKSVANYSHARSEPQEPQKEPGESAPARKVIHYKSPHLDPRHFVNGYVPSGTGTSAVEVYYERFSINQDAARLSPIKEDDLVHFCTDLGKLREVITAYSRTAYQPGNVQLILDWYKNGIPKRDKPPNNTNGYQQNGRPSNSDREVILARARTARQNIKTAELTGMPVDARDLKAIEAARGLT